MRRFPLVLAALALTATACGTTVQANMATGGNAGDAFGVPDHSSAVSGGGLSAPAGSPAVGGSALTSTGSGPSGPVATGSAGVSDTSVAPERGATAAGAGGTAEVAAPGVTSDTILIGVIDAASQDQVLADAGIKGASQGSNERKANALIDVINGRGGIHGRKLKLVVHKGTRSSTPQSICADFTQDRRVFAVLDYGQRSSDEFRACVSKAGVLQLADHGTYFDERDLRAHPTLWPVGGFRIDRKTPAYVDGLAAQGFFEPWNHNTAAPADTGQPKVGLVYLEEDFNRRQNPRLRAALAKHGMKFVSEFGIRNNSNAYADLNAAVLRFASDGITHVLFNNEISGAVFGNFALNASGQGYYPRYGVSSYDFPVIVKTNVPDHRAFNGLKGVGWLPYSDVDKPAAMNEMQKSCLKLFTDRGQTPADANERTIMLISCDVWFKFEKVAGSLGRSLNAPAFMSAVPSLGSSASTYAWTTVDYSRHRDGITSVNYLEFGADCDCFRYTRTGVPSP